MAAIALRPGGPTVRPTVLALVRAGTVLGGYAVVLVEALGAIGELRGRWLAVGWAVALVVLTAVAVARGTLPVRTWAADVRRRVVGLPAVDRVVLATIVALAVAELTIVLVAVPNTWDSMAYHLPRIETWLSQRSVDVFPTYEYRQATLAPGAELLLTSLRVLAGGPALYGFLQWGATLGCLLLVVRIAAQLGATTRGQLVSAFVVATIPLVVLEATSTQVDMVAAFWAATSATLVLDGIRARAGWATAAFLGLAVGLGTVTKSTVPVSVAPLLLLWAAAQLTLHVRPREHRLAGAAALLGKAVVCVLLVAAAAGPFYHRNLEEYGALSGPDKVAEIHTTARHDPPALVMCVARASTGVLATPFAGVNSTMQRAVGRLGVAVDVDPSDPDITIPGGRYGVPTYQRFDEDTAPFPVQALVLAAGVLLALLGRRQSWLVRYYAASVVVMSVVYATTLNYQSFLNRLLLTVPVLAAPLLGAWLATRPTPDGSSGRRARASRLLTTGLVAVVGFVCAGSGALAVLAGRPRALVGVYSVFTHPPDEQMFALAPGRERVYTWAADEIASTGHPERVGTLMPGGAWEYPLWFQLDRRGVDATIVSLRTTTPRTKAPPASGVDVVFCLHREEVCRRELPADWTAVELVGAALPATVLRPPVVPGRR